MKIAAFLILIGVAVGIAAAHAQGVGERMITGAPDYTVRIPAQPAPPRAPDYRAYPYRAYPYRAYPYHAYPYPYGYWTRPRVVVPRGSGHRRR